MRLLLSSDIHCDHAAAARLVTQAEDADVLVCAGDLAVMRKGLQGTVDVLAEAACPVVLVPGNGESHEELVEACREWEGARVLHGDGCEIDGVDFWGVGGGIPVTPFGSWSYDFTEEEAEEMLADCPEGAVLVSHSPPFGHVDTDSGGSHLGSRAILEAVRDRRPRLTVCGHIHACWTERSDVDGAPVINAGPEGVWFEL